MKDEKYLKWIRTKPCVLCQNIYTNPHHLRDPERKHTRRFADIRNVVPLCFRCHIEVIHKYPKIEEGYSEGFRLKAERLYEEYQKRK